MYKDYINDYEEALQYASKVNHYDVLGVSQDATADDIKQAYLNKIAKFQGRGQFFKGSNPLTKEEKAEKASIQEAYETLHDPDTRKKHDVSLLPVAKRAPQVAEPAPKRGFWDRYGEALHEHLMRKYPLFRALIPEKVEELQPESKPTPKKPPQQPPPVAKPPQQPPPVAKPPQQPPPVAKPPQQPPPVAKPPQQPPPVAKPPQPPPVA